MSLSNPQHHEHPLLVMIDAVRGTDAVPFASDPLAAHLESRARTLADEYWPETLWLTGNISATLFDAVTMRLEAERQSLHAGLRVFVATERPSRASA